MVHLSIRVVDLPSSFGPYGVIRLVHQSKKGYMDGKDGVFEIELTRKADRSGMEQWSGDSVFVYGDKRRFLYFAWVSEKGQMFRRIKLYLDQIDGLQPDPQAVEVEISGRGKDGTPACSIARVIR